MLTIFDVFRFFAAIVGALVGGTVGGNYFELVGGALGGIGGLALGWWLGDLPWLISLRFVLGKLNRVPTDELVASIRERRTMTPQVVLLELHRRGHDIWQELPNMVAWLESESSAQRSAGLVALRSAFPALAIPLQCFSPFDSTEECREKAAVFRHDIATSTDTSPSH